MSFQKFEALLRESLPCLEDYFSRSEHQATHVANSSLSRPERPIPLSLPLLHRSSLSLAALGSLKLQMEIFNIHRRDDPKLAAYRAACTFYYRPVHSAALTMPTDPHSLRTLLSLPYSLSPYAVSSCKLPCLDASLASPLLWSVAVFSKC